ncbi:MAG TPA: methylenetetrahydrofolate reductase [Pseudomonadales bacterium]|jgi:methylenetetrahydrofolate reductase (NADPH)|nr:methylenetetrahydrofolate reductase [Pseudomonadales bacterium]
MRTSLEIVPRSLAELDAAISLIAARYPRIDTVNVPDRPSCDLRSTDAAHHIRGRIAHRIPHLRACDFDESSASLLIETLTERGIDEVIVVAGDKADAANGFEPTALIRHLATHAAWVSVYAALDPHRYRDDSALMRNVAQKREAGACGFFTQPLFDLHDIDRCSEALGEATTFWGLSPVVSDRSQRYWQQVNSVRFPSEFVPTLNWNQSFALRFLSEIADRGGNAYLMPIKVDIERYLAPLAARFA